MDDLEDFLISQGWPVGLQNAILQSKKDVAFRFVVVDNSRSMLKRDYHEVTRDGIRTRIHKKGTRWVDVAESVRVIAGLASCTNALTEIRLINNSSPVIVGQSKSVEDEFTRVASLLSSEPYGQTPICAQLNKIVRKMTKMEGRLRKSNRNALIFIMTDGTSSDGDVANVLRALLGFPVQIIIRIFTDEKEIIDYWHEVNSNLNLDITILKSVKDVAGACARKNSWLTYGEPLLLLRGFGVKIPGLDVISYRQLNRDGIKDVCHILLEHQRNIECLEFEKTGGIEGDLFSDPSIPWESFIKQASDLASKAVQVFCPVKQEYESWLQLERLFDSKVDLVDALLERNEDLFWCVYLSRASLFPSGPNEESHSPEGTPERPETTNSSSRNSPKRAEERVKVKFGGSSKYEKKMLEKGVLWQLFTDLDFVPAVMNTIRFNRLVGEIKGTSKISFREFVVLVLRIADLAFPKKSPLIRIVKVLNIMNRSDALARIVQSSKEDLLESDHTADGAGAESECVSEYFLLPTPAQLRSSATVYAALSPLRISIALPNYNDSDFNSTDESPWSVLKERSRSPKDGLLFSPSSVEKFTVSHLGGRTLKSYFNQRFDLWGNSPGDCKNSPMDMDGSMSMDVAEADTSADALDADASMLSADAPGGIQRLMEALDWLHDDWSHNGGDVPMANSAQVSPVNSPNVSPIRSAIVSSLRITQLSPLKSKNTSPVRVANVSSLRIAQVSPVRSTDVSPLVITNITPRHVFNSERPFLLELPKLESRKCEESPDMMSISGVYDIPSIEFEIEEEMGCAWHEGRDRDEGRFFVFPPPRCPVDRQGMVDEVPPVSWCRPGHDIDKLAPISISQSVHNPLSYNVCKAGEADSGVLPLGPTAPMSPDIPSSEKSVWGSGTFAVTMPPHVVMSRRSSLRPRIEPIEASAIELEMRNSVRLEANSRLRTINEKQNSARFIGYGISQGCPVTADMFSNSEDVYDQKSHVLSNTKPFSERFNLSKDRKKTNIRDHAPRRALDMKCSTPNCVSWFLKKLGAVGKYLSTPPLFR